MPFSTPIPYKSLMRWLLLCCFLIWALIMVGGATRLTHAGLSIVEWKPIQGIIPPLSEHQWSLEFEKYQQFPEYKLLNNHITKQDFKFIFWMEYTHRLLGRLVGLFFALPLLYFWVKGQLPSFIKRRSVFILGLGMAQGFMGWYMVKSGLVKDPTVSHLRLTVHLGLAFILFSTILWTAFDLTPSSSFPKEKNLQQLHRLGLVTMGLTSLTIVYGAFVAGLKAGLIYNTFPLMGGEWIPSEWLFYKPLYLNFLENQATVQWVHRWLGLSTFLMVFITTHKGFKAATPLIKKVSGRWLMVACLQVIVGILTLLHGVPVILGTLHQGTAVVVVAMGLWFIWLTKQKKLA